MRNFGVSFKRVDVLGGWLAPVPRLLALGVVIGVLITIRSWPRALALVIYAYALASLSGRRIRLSYFALFCLSVVFFALLNPFGQVVGELGPLRITMGALEEGLLRAFRLTGLVFASLAGLSRGLRLPGRFGRFLSLALDFYQALLESRSRLAPRRWVESLDAILFEVFPLTAGDPPRPAEVPKPEPRAERLWGGVLGGLAIASVALLVALWP